MSENHIDRDFASDYIRFMHVVMVMMLIAIGGLGFGIVHTANQGHEVTLKALQLEKERDAAILENIQLKELMKPVQKKIEKAGVYIHKKYGIDKSLAMSYARQEMIDAGRTGMDYSLGLAISATESSFQYDARTWCCYSIKGVHLGVWSKEFPGLTKADVTDPYKNIAIGYDILKIYYSMTGSVPKALERYYGSTDPAQNVAYAEKVLRRKAEIERALRG